MLSFRSVDPPLLLPSMMQPCELLHFYALEEEYHTVDQHACCVLVFSCWDAGGGVMGGSQVQSLTPTPPNHFGPLGGGAKTQTATSCWG